MLLEPRCQLEFSLASSFLLSIYDPHGKTFLQEEEEVNASLARIKVETTIADRKEILRKEFVFNSNRLKEGIRTQSELRSLGARFLSLVSPFSKEAHTKVPLPSREKRGERKYSPFPPSFYP